MALHDQLADLKSIYDSQKVLSAELLDHIYSWDVPPYTNSPFWGLRTVSIRKNAPNLQLFRTLNSEGVENSIRSIV